MTSTLDHSRKSPLLLCGNHITNTLHEYTAWLDILGNGISTLLENSLWCIKCTFTMQWQQYLLPVSCFHFSVSLLHAWLFWKMTSLFCWKFTLVYRVQIYYVMATILVAFVLQSLQNNTIGHEYQWFSEIDTSQNICDWQLSKRTAHRIYIELMRAILSKVTTLYCEYRITIQSYNTGSTFIQH